MLGGNVNASELVKVEFAVDLGARHQ
uniref:Uncharacterized protein n=1 Tax=Ralstonia solanacearum TaxID=305 RepID=A0A0S4U6Z3_RALSL|nr:protein of unknown function [Ralstonia solanacearum]